MKASLILSAICAMLISTVAKAEVVMLASNSDEITADQSEELNPHRYEADIAYANRVSDSIAAQLGGNKTASAKQANNDRGFTVTLMKIKKH